MLRIGVLTYRKWRVHPPLPPHARLQKWLQRAHTKSQHFKRPRVFLLPDRLMEVLGLPDPLVELDAQGHLWSDSKVIAHIE